jgi:hypothetical protein
VRAALQAYSTEVLDILNANAGCVICSSTLSVLILPYAVMHACAAASIQHCRVLCIMLGILHGEYSVCEE